MRGHDDGPQADAVFPAVMLPAGQSPVRIVRKPASNEAARLLPIGNGVGADKEIEWKTMNYIRRHENPIQKLNWPAGEKD